ncbi:MAG: terpene cyclase/mutase family protein, partial [Phycisphaerales bacterium]|nr:terpene cyclase/mutase family protein [Phycisphaerales bacterium]
ALCVSVSLCSIPAFLANAQPDEPAPSRPQPGAENAALEGEITPELDRAVTAGLAYLASQQEPDGGWGGGSYGKNVAVTALACLAFMGDGNLPDRGPYAENVALGLDYILNNTSPNGLIAADAANGPMYGHGFATLFLGEVYGMTAGGADTRLSARTYEALAKAVRLIEQSQNQEGGWRYNPVPFDADTSVTICQIMALRSARNAGLDVPKATIDRAVEYVRSCQNPDGGFRYQRDNGTSAWPRSAAGVASLFYAGIYEDEGVDRGLDYIDGQSPFPGAGQGRPSHFYYGHYYTVQAMYLAGGEHWAAYWPRIREELIATQGPDGSWVDPSVGSAYGTAMSLIILQMPKRYLPIFQK